VQARAGVALATAIVCIGQRFDARGGDVATPDHGHNARRERVVGWLESAGLRPTRQRRALADLLIGDGRNRHVTAESLFAAARDAGSGVALATVYNTLKTFTEAGLLLEITVDGARSYFDTRTEEHPHFYWESDGTLRDAPVEGVEIARLPAPPAGTEIARVDVVIRLRGKA
jgi:Fur family iron response transcriptional regulator